jgi:hypothetical protein
MRLQKLGLALVISAIAAMGPARSVRAQHLGDILLSVINGSIDTGRIALDGTLTTGLRVFEVPFSTLTPGFTDTPGFDDTPGTFPVPSTIGFRLRAALRKWNGADFSQIPPETILVNFGPLGPVSTPPTDTVVTGFSLSVGSNGEWHRHLEYTLSQPQSDGIYLTPMSLFSSSPNIGESRPFWLVFGMNASQPDLDTAAAWVHLHLACGADFNNSGAVTVQDIFDFLSAYFASSPSADVNGSGTVTVQDIFDYLAAYFAGCS